MTPYTPPLPAPKAESEAARPTPPPIPARSAPPPLPVGSLMDHILAARRKRMQETVAERTEQRRRNWVGWIGAALGAALVVYMNQPGTKAETHYPPPEIVHDGIGHGVVKEDAGVGYGCPSKAHIEKIRELIARAPKSLMWRVYADDNCRRFPVGTRFVIDRHNGWDGTIVARLPGDFVQLWFSAGVFDLEKPR